MLNTDQEVYSAVTRYICELTGITAIQSHQDGERPCKPYIMTNLIQIDEVREHACLFEYVELDTVNDAGFKEIQKTPAIEYEWVFSIHSYGDEPTGALRKIKAAAQYDGANIAISPELNLFDVGVIKRLPEYINAKFEMRANMQLYIRGYARDSLIVDTIEEAPVEVVNKTLEEKLEGIDPPVVTPPVLVTRSAIIDQNGNRLTDNLGNVLIVEQ